MPLFVISYQALILRTKHYDNLSFVPNIMKLFWRLCLRSVINNWLIDIKTEDAAKVAKKKRCTAWKQWTKCRKKAKSSSEQEGSSPAKWEEKPITKGKCCGCGKDRMGTNCIPKETTCNFCNKFGHIEAVCFSKKCQEGKPSCMQNHQRNAD